MIIGGRNPEEKRVAAIQRKGIKEQEKKGVYPWYWNKFRDPTTLKI